jgi:cell division transport system permease protein
MAKSTRSRGAIGSKIGLAGRFRSLLSHHRATLYDSFLRMLREPVQTFMSSAVIAIALSLPATLYLAVENIRQLEGSFESFSQITVYVKKEADQQQIQQLQNQLLAMSQVADITYISAEQALSEFKAISGFGSALEHLENNPLPAVFVIEPRLAEHMTVDQTEALLEGIKSLPTIDDVQIDMLWLQRLRSLTQMGQKIAVALAGVLGLGVLLIIGNSIRMAIHSRRDEILIVKLVGGTDAYVRRPFLYGGMLLGTMGSLGSALLLFAGFWWLGESVEHLSRLYSSEYRLLGPSVQGFLALLAIGAILGILGSWIAVSRHLKDIKPK